MYTPQELIETINAHIDSLEYDPRLNNLYDPVRYALHAGGKRMRSVLLLMAHNLFSDDFQTALPYAAALETFHNFTLLHDDLMDHADKRRGKPTVHVKWDENTAILSGDAMLTLSMHMMTQGKGIRHEAALETFIDAALGVCEGQQFDMDFEKRDDVTEEEYMEMIRLKTSVLLACALKVGALVAGADDENADWLYRCGEKIGLAFQLQDDLLDVYGDPVVFGKNIGGDILENKKTFMLINALKKANEDQRLILEQWISATDYVPEEKIKAVTNVYNIIGMKAICERQIQILFTQGLEALGKVNLPEERKEPLRDYLLSLLERKK